MPSTPCSRAQDRFISPPHPTPALTATDRVRAASSQQPGTPPGSPRGCSGPRTWSTCSLLPRRVNTELSVQRGGRKAGTLHRGFSECGPREGRPRPGLTASSPPPRLRPLGAEDTPTRGRRSLRVSVRLAFRKSRSGRHRAALALPLPLPVPPLQQWPPLLLLLLPAPGNPRPRTSCSRKATRRRRKRS